MKNFTRGLRQLLCLGLLAAPGLARAQAQTWQWAAGPSGAGSLSVVRGTALDAAGNEVVAGYFSGTLTFGATTLTSAGGYDVFVARLSPLGVWTQAVQAGGPGDDVAYTLALDANGNALVAGYFGTTTGVVGGNVANFGTTALTSAGRYDAFVAQLSPTGTWTRAVRAGGIGNDVIFSLAADGLGNATVAGSFTDALTFGSTTLATNFGPDVFVARLSANGTWTQAAQAGGSGSDLPSGLVVDANGTATVVGYFQNDATFGTIALTGAGGARDVFVARLSAAGTWVQAIPAGGANDDYANAVALDGAGNAVVAGVFRGSAAFGPTTLTQVNAASILGGFVAKLSPAGVWTQALKVDGPNSVLISALAVDAADNVVVTGSFDSSASFGNTTLNSAGLEDIFVARLTPAGQWAQAIRAGGSGSDQSRAVVVDRSGAAVAAGFVQSPAAFGPLVLSSSSTTNTAFVARVGGLGLGTRAAFPHPRFALAPNPATATVSVVWPETTAAASIQVLDMLGREVRRQELPFHTSAATLDVTGLAPGMYVVRCGGATSQLQVE
ncbi:T9SS type A sorting domain-containing protein [Hymenobacter sp. 5317J-9]|uniref:T9SS type A sorting domain-containing protein n=1 Tax=Hymenobacter sp. 5317J-9 TaxID=2932250 RepID=UPI001FD6CB84|nr:T9SS type A sorting domain-containing protein [Hymenobacter sp. 5317J-9]UOQ98441.1 T9SS type A sorting domain-containing protein [Hymenobacter sp. 5317J-9]